MDLGDNLDYCLEENVWILSFMTEFSWIFGEHQIICFQVFFFALASKEHH